MKEVYNIFLNDSYYSHISQHYFDKNENGLVIEFERFDPDKCEASDLSFRYNEEYFIAY